MQHGRADGADELTAGRHGLSGDDGEGFIDLGEIHRRRRHHRRRQASHAQHAGTEHVGPGLRRGILTRSLHDRGKDESAGGGEIARTARRILLGRKITAHRRLDEQHDQPVFGFITDAFQGRAEGRDLRRRELTQGGHGKVEQGHARAGRDGTEQSVETTGLLDHFAAGEGFGLGQLGGTLRRIMTKDEPEHDGHRAHRIFGGRA